MNAPVTNLPVKAEPKRSVLVEMATRFGMEPKAFADTLCATVFPKEGTNEEFLAFLLVANEYGLNPLTKEIYAFPKKGGGIQPIVSIDGWLNIINSHSQLNGIEFDDHLTGDKVSAITARIWRKDRDKPIVVTEYLAECVRQTDPWKQYPRRMLRHKALIQCARYAFGFAGIVDPDEAERIGVDVSPMRTVGRDDGPPAPPPQTIEHRPQVAMSAASRDDDIERVESGRDDGHQVEWGDASTENATTLAPGDGELSNWRKDAEGALSGCSDSESFFHVNKTVIAPAKGKVSAADWQAVALVSKQTFDRLSMAD